MYINIAKTIVYGDACFQGGQCKVVLKNVLVFSRDFT